MKDVLFYRDAGDLDVFNWVSSLGEASERIYEDLLIVGREGPEFFSLCRHLRDDLWVLSRRIEPGVDATMIFFHHLKADVYIVLHGFKARAEGVTSHDLRLARSRRREFG